MRILHIDTGREMRGGQWQVLYLLEGLVALGHGVTLLARSGAPLAAAARAKGFDVRAATLAAALGARADVVHAHDARAHLLAAFARGVPLVVARRVAFPLHTGILSRWKYRRAAHYIAVSEHVAAVLAAAGIARSRVSVVYDGVPPAPSGSPGARIVAPATRDPQKGSALVEAAAARGRFSVHFSTDLPRDLAGAAVFVYITHQEGLGSGALLAMASGVPVVASRAGGLPEIVVDGETGLLVDNTPEAIAAAVTRLAQDRAFATRLGAAGRRMVETRFSVAHMVQGTLAVYHRVLPCSKPR
ncbi:MAG TPA: glycosyltransferase family 4 protein [Bryobacteraceae bacterium]